MLGRFGREALVTDIALEIDFINTGEEGLSVNERNINQSKLCECQ